MTAGNASGVNDGAAAMIVASEEAAVRGKLRPRARILGMATAGVPPRVMGIGPVPATRKLLARLGKSIADFDWIQLNEAFASQRLLASGNWVCPMMPSMSTHGRRDCTGASAGHERRTAGDDGRASVGEVGRKACVGIDVYRGGPGYCAGNGARLRR